MVNTATAWVLSLHPHNWRATSHFWGTFARIAIATHDAADLNSVVTLWAVRQVDAPYSLSLCLTGKAGMLRGFASSADKAGCKTTWILHLYITSHDASFFSSKQYKPRATHMITISHHHCRNATKPMWFDTSQISEREAWNHTTSLNWYKACA